MTFFLVVSPNRHWPLFHREYPETAGEVADFLGLNKILDGFQGVLGASLAQHILPQIISGLRIQGEFRTGNESRHPEGQNDIPLRILKKNPRSHIG